MQHTVRALVYKEMATPTQQHGTRAFRLARGAHHRLHRRQRRVQRCVERPKQPPRAEETTTAQPHKDPLPPAKSHLEPLATSTVVPLVSVEVRVKARMSCPWLWSSATTTRSTVTPAGTASVYVMLPLPLVAAAGVP
jgi:hypothetical protein